jgi:REP element-mobilizing transposase RayT
VEGNQPVFGPADREMLVEYMRMYEKLLGLHVISYCIMPDHLHLLVEVPERPADCDLPDDAALIALIRSTLGDKLANKLDDELTSLREEGNKTGLKKAREEWFRRMWNLGFFMKVFKQRFAQWFNRQHERRGLLWNNRYDSMIVEGKREALHTVAAYIDLNPVRMDLCEDPKEYLWSGYGAAVAGVEKAGDALVWLTSLAPGGGVLPKPKQTKTVKDAIKRWNGVLSGGLGPKRKFSREKTVEKLENGESLPRPEYLRCRSRFMTEGEAIGSRKFVEKVFSNARDHFGKNRQTGARPVEGLAWDDESDRLYVLHVFKSKVFG